MAAQAALLYQETPVGVFLPNSAEKSRAMPTSTSANRAAITSLIDVFFYILVLVVLQQPCWGLSTTMVKRRRSELVGFPLPSYSLWRCTSLCFSSFCLLSSQQAFDQIWR